jgi:diaminopimelate decarboxylase
VTDHFTVRDGALYAEEIPVADIARRFGTPTYIYSRATLERHYRAFDDALAAVPHQVCYAVKANSNLAVLGVLAHLGSGFDIVSAGELRRVLAAGGDPSKVVAWARPRTSCASRCSSAWAPSTSNPNPSCAGSTASRRNWACARASRCA